MPSTLIPTEQGLLTSVLVTHGASSSFVVGTVPCAIGCLVATLTSNSLDAGSNPSSQHPQPVVIETIPGQGERVVRWPSFPWCWETLPQNKTKNVGAVVLSTWSLITWTLQSYDVHVCMLSHSVRTALYFFLKDENTNISPMQLLGPPLKIYFVIILRAFLVAQIVKSACNAGDMGSILGSGRSLEEGMATHSSIHAWKIPWTEEPSGLRSMESQRVRHDWVTNTLISLSTILKSKWKKKNPWEVTLLTGSLV